MLHHIIGKLKVLLGIAAADHPDAVIIAELLDSAESEEDIRKLFESSDIGPVPTEVFAPAKNIAERRHSSRVAKAPIEPKSAPRTGSTAKSRRIMTSDARSINVVGKTNRHVA